MSAKKLKMSLWIASFFFLMLACPVIAANLITPFLNNNIRPIAEQLGWVVDENNSCHGYYLEPAFPDPDSQAADAIAITSHQGFIAQRNTSTLEGDVTLTRQGQQVTANKMHIYRHPDTFKLSYAEMIGDVHLREPNTLIIGKKGRYEFETEAKSLIDILYRTTFSGKNLSGPHVPANEINQPRIIAGMTAWGKAHQFSQTEPNVYHLSQVSYTTCPPINPTWQVKAQQLVLNKNTGRGHAIHARVFIKNIPVFYAPYLNFPIDDRRQSGFLFPTIGGNNQFGPYMLIPFYWNIVPNADMTITPGILTKRGMQITDQFRYLTPYNLGIINMSILPNDRFYDDFKQSQKRKYQSSLDPATQAELNRLLNSSPNRQAFSWRNESHYGQHWFSHVNFNYVSDDYYLTDFGNNLHEINSNLVLQEGEIDYKGQHWNMIGRVQAYQTLHPIDDSPVKNVYKRLPQIILEGNYPDQLFGLEYFVKNEVTHFEILKDPGSNISLPIGNRLHVQPGISLPLYQPYLYLNPRLQFALSAYELAQTKDTNTPHHIHRAIPIFDIASGLSFSRELSLFRTDFQQTLEPQIYYTYIPYRDQRDIPVFDTTVNTLYYDQLFNYNRFTGIDRIGDANQVGLGITTRLIDQTSGLEKVRLGIGNILYFSKRRVTLCNDTSCTDNPENPSNHWKLSPISGVLDYHINPVWILSNNTIWNPISKQLDNTTVGLHFQPEPNKLINIGFNFARGGDVLSGVQTIDSSNNLKVTNVSFNWPIFREVSALGLWSQNWNHKHLQNLLYGLQYDTCCWAVRMVGGRAFTGVDPKNNNQPQYNTEFYLQFSLKGLGNIGRDASSALNSISGYQTQFGQVF